MAEPPIEGLKALAHPSRFAILSTLAQGERNVGEIETATGIGQPGLSQQLSILRNAGLVASRRDAKMVFYCLDADAMGTLANALAALVPSPEKACAPAAASRGRKMAGAAVFAQLR